MPDKDNQAAAAADSFWMARALELARQGVGLASPNPCVGAVVVGPRGAVGEGTHTYAGLKHAEVLALEQAGADALGATLYLNLEPCCHTGRTGPCAERIIAAGIRRVVAAMADPNPLVAGKGFECLRQAGIEVSTGLGASEARRLNEAFVHWIRTQRPLVTLKAALTLDGQIAFSRGPHTGPQRITGDLARAHVQELRHRSDAILVGIGTVLADDPLLTDRSGKPRRRPLLRVVLDSHLRLPVSSRLVQSAQEDVLVFCSGAESWRRSELERGGVRVEELAGAGSSAGVNLKSAIRRLGALQIASLLVEGGSSIHGALLRNQVADKILLYYAPRLFGSGGVPLASSTPFASLEDAPHVHQLTWHQLGEDFAVEGYLHDPYED
jgi:diaminohydroxyphosphoribosylaminopyrimidine deaminase/5-amino-6-(5-phosphoribosylamino)uracil reductase